MSIYVIILFIINKITYYEGFIDICFIDSPYSGTRIEGGDGT